MAHGQTHNKELGNGKEFDRLSSPSNPRIWEINDYPKDVQRIDYFYLQRV